VGVGFSPVKEDADAWALEGVRVVDFGHYIAGPLAATMLSDQGADVVHVDPPAVHAGTPTPTPSSTGASAGSAWT